MTSAAPCAYRCQHRMLPYRLLYTGVFTGSVSLIIVRKCREMLLRRPTRGTTKLSLYRLQSGSAVLKVQLRRRRWRRSFDGRFWLVIASWTSCGLWYACAAFPNALAKSIARGVLAFNGFYLHATSNGFKKEGSYLAEIAFSCFYSPPSSGAISWR